MGPEVKIKLKEAMKVIAIEGKKLPKPVWIAVLIVPFGFEVLGAYLIAKAVMKRKK